MKREQTLTHPFRRRLRVFPPRRPSTAYSSVPRIRTTIVTAAEHQDLAQFGFVAGIA